MRATTRERHLGSDERTGVVARRSVRDRHRRFVRDHWPSLLLLSALLLSIFGACAWFASGPLQRGLVLGTGITFTACALGGAVVLFSGTAPLLAGGIAESWTADELRPLREHGWRLVNHAGLGHGDLDHVLVGPGGIVLVETKWRSDPKDVAEGQWFFEAAVERVARSARQLAGWAEVARHDHPPVLAVLAVWGPGARDLRERRHSSGVVVVPGPALRAWMLRRARSGLVAEQSDAVFAALDRQVAGRDRYENDGRPIPRTLMHLARAVGTGVVAAFGVLLVVGWLGSSYALIGGTALLAAAVGSEVAARRTRWTWEVRAGQLTAALVVALAVASVAA